MRILLPVVFFLHLLLSACVRTDVPPHRLVVEGWIESGEFPVVQITLPYRPGESGSVENAVARPARVMISDGEKEWQLTGMYDAGYFPPYIYTSFELRGETGRRYSLSVSFDGMEAYAETEILPSSPILSAYFVPVPGDDGARRLQIVTEKDAVSDLCLMTMVRTASTGSRAVPSYLGVVRIPQGEGEVSLEVMRPRYRPDTVPYETCFRVGEEIEVRLCRLTADAFGFWSDYQNAVSIGGSPLISSACQLRSNVSGDGIGCFFGYGADRRLLRVE